MPNISKKQVKDIIDSSRVEGKELLAWFKRQRGFSNPSGGSSPSDWITSTLETERAEQFYAKFILFGHPNIKSLEKVDTEGKSFKKMFNSTDDIKWLSRWLPNESCGVCSSCECYTNINPLTGEYFEWCEECTEDLEEQQRQEQEYEEE
jgi:hypothetical protein